MSSTVISEANELKNEGNDAFRRGDVSMAQTHYSSALQKLPIKKHLITDEIRQLSAMLLSNRAMCQLKQYDISKGHQDHMRDNQIELFDACIADCTEGLRNIESISVSTNQLHSTKSKLLYRRARAYFTVTDLLNSREDIATNLNSAAKDLLSILSFDEGNKEASELLRTIKKKYGDLGGGRSKIARALDHLRGDCIVQSSSSSQDEITHVNCLRIIQASLTEDALSSAEEVGRNGGVSILLSIACNGIKNAQIKDPKENIQCRITSIHILSTCCSHDSFILKYALRDALPPVTLAQIVEEENEPTGSSDIVIAIMALLIRLIVHWDHREVMRFFAAKIEEDGTVQDNYKPIANALEVDASSICRVAIAALSWGSKWDDISTTAPRAALDLLSAWTTFDLDSLDAASNACFDASPSTASSPNFKKAVHTKLTQDDIRRMKPRQVAAHRQRESKYREANLDRAIQHITMFCSSETGGLDALLTLCATTYDHRLRREVGLQLGRMISLFEEEDHVKKLAARALGCVDWKAAGDKEATGIETLTIEELDEKEDAKEKLFSMMKRGQMVACLLLGKFEVGTWALKHGWSDGKGVEELKQLAFSGDSRAMSIVSELVSEAASVESARPMLAPLVEEGTLDDLLVHPDSDVRSGAASCAAKIGLASKALSEDDGEVMELLDVAIELLFDENGLDSSNSKNTKGNNIVSSTTETTSMDRGIEVISYLAQKTFVKNKIANGYKPNGSTLNCQTVIQRLVEIACAPSSGDAQAAFGLASIFNLLAVSIETLRKEAFIGKEITKEQYDQLQALGKTEEEKEIEAKKDEWESDSPNAVTKRIQKLANANVPRAMVKLLDGSNTNSTQQKLLEGMGRMASEASVRGTLIQQGCLSACIQFDKGDKPNEAEKGILRQARGCIAKLLITTNPNILTVSQRSGSIGPLIKLVKDNDALDLMHFEALLSLTNLAGNGDETKTRIVAQKGIPIISYAMFSDHEMVRRAATECLCNMVGHREMMEYLHKEENLKVWCAFASDYEENFACARAAIGGLAMAISDPDVAHALIKNKHFQDMIRTLTECGQPELMHRVFVLIAGLIEHGGACRDAVISTGAGAFCKAYVASYHEEQKVKEFNFSLSEQGAFEATLRLAKDIVIMLNS